MDLKSRERKFDASVVEELHGILFPEERDGRGITPMGWYLVDSWDNTNAAYRAALLFRIPPNDYRAFVEYLMEVAPDSIKDQLKDDELILSYNEISIVIQQEPEQ